MRANIMSGVQCERRGRSMGVSCVPHCWAGAQHSQSPMNAEAVW